MTTTTKRSGACDACELRVINGHRCHEIGCPEAWRETERECRWCGRMFEPQEKHQRECEESCTRAYHGLPDDD